MRSYTAKTICPYDCPTTCGLLAETDGTNILSVRGDPNHPAAKGLICKKMRHYQRSVHDPRRLLTPMRRVGPKGEGRFAPITWDEAILEITHRWKSILAQDGPQAILPLYYSGVMSVIQRNCGDAFFHRMGACSLVKTLCSSAKGAGYEAVAGKTGCLDPRELKDSQLLLVWGSNMKATRLQSMPELRRVRQSGGKVILIEACGVDMAPYCDQVVLVRPGSDGALALAMMHVLVRDHLADEAFLQSQCVGYEAFKATLGAYSPAWAQDITGVPAEDIEQLAHAFASVRSPAIILGSGPSRYANGGMTTRLITILSAFTGAWGRPGGGLCGCTPSSSPYIDNTRVSRPDLRTASPRTVNINQVASALNGTDGQRPVQSLFVFGGNPVASISNQSGIITGLLRPELFTVVHERFLTDTARYADILLPATFSVEQTDCYTAYGYCTFATARRLIPPPGACKSNWDTFRLLAAAMGYDEPYFQQNEEALLEDLLAHPMGDLAAATEEELRQLRAGGAWSAPFADHLDWKTASGKLHIVNDALEEPMPRYTPVHGGADPLQLFCVPSCDTLNSIFLERDDLAGRRGAMPLLLHPTDARQRGIADGDLVTAFNELGQVDFMAQLTELVAPGSVAAPGVYDLSRSVSGALVNTLHHERLSDLAAATTLNDNTVEVRKA